MSPSAGAPAALAEDGSSVSPGPGLQSPPGAVCPLGAFLLTGCQLPSCPPPQPPRGRAWAGRHAGAQAAVPVQASAPGEWHSAWGMGRKAVRGGPPLVCRIALNIMSGPCFSIIIISIVIVLPLIAGRGRFVPSRAPYGAPSRRREPPFPVPPSPSMVRRAVGRHLGSGQAAWSSLAGWCFPGGRGKGGDGGRDESSLTVKGSAEVVAVGEGDKGGSSARRQDVARSLSRRGGALRRRSGVSAVGGSGKRLDRAWR